MEHHEKDKNETIKRVIGFLIIAAVAFFILTNFDLGDWPKLGFMLEGPKTTCTEIRAPKVMTDTVVERLRVEDLGFEVINEQRTAEITIKNIDKVRGTVRVVLYCKDGDGQGDQQKNLLPGETGIFEFTGVDDCDTEYIIEPELMSRQVNRTVYATDSVCE